MSSDTQDMPKAPMPEQKLTALQCWNMALRSSLETNFMMATRNGIVPIRKYWQKVEAAIQQAEAFEVTKHRAIVDELVKKLEDANKYENDILNRHAATHWLRFAKRRRLNQEYALAINVRLACGQCLLIVVNTPPSVPSPQPSMN